MTITNSINVKADISLITVCSLCWDSPCALCLLEYASFYSCLFMLSSSASLGIVRFMPCTECTVIKNMNVFSKLYNVPSGMRRCKRDS